MEEYSNIPLVGKTIIEQQGLLYKTLLEWLNTFREQFNKIGNKILLEQSINGTIGNAWFRGKKQNSINDRRGYKDSNFPIAKSLVNYKKDLWEKEDIDTATEKAAQRIVSFIFVFSTLSGSREIRGIQ